MMNLVLSFSSRARLPRPCPGRPSARTWPNLRKEASPVTARFNRCLKKCSSEQALARQAICLAVISPVQEGHSSEGRVRTNAQLSRPLSSRLPHVRVN